LAPPNRGITGSVDLGRGLFSDREQEEHRIPRFHGFTTNFYAVEAWKRMLARKYRANTGSPIRRRLLLLWLVANIAVSMLDWFNLLLK
jgi:hypothetical protein